MSSCCSCAVTDSVERTSNLLDPQVVTLAKEEDDQIEKEKEKAMTSSVSRKTVTFERTEWEKAENPDRGIMLHIWKNRSVPLHFMRYKIQAKLNEPTCPIVLHIGSLFNFPCGEDLTEAEASSTEYSLNISLFDSQYNQFFGKTWRGPRLLGQYDEKSVTLSYKQNVYFHTWIKDSSLVLAVEIVRHQTVKGKESSTTCAWMWLHPFANPDDLEDISEAKPNTQQTDLYYGSARALLYLEEPFAKYPQLRKIENACLTYAIQTHSGLQKVMELIPDNVLVGGSCVIPGIVEESSNRDGIKDFLRRPKLCRKSPCYLENIVIKLSPSIEKFEEELCKYLNEDRLARDGRPADGSVVSVLERRLQVGVHNGWCYVETPQVFHLFTDAVADKIRRGHKRTSSWDGRSRNGPAATGLVLKNRVELGCMVDDPLCSVVFKLEYVLAEPLGANEKKESMQRLTNVTACVRWLAWCPFGQSSPSELTLELVGGACQIPDNVLVFTERKRVDDEDRQSPGMISFKFVNQKKQATSSLPLPKEEEVMDRMNVATVAAEASVLPVSLPPESARRPPSRRSVNLAMDSSPTGQSSRYELDRLSPSPQPMIGRDAATPFMMQSHYNMMSFPQAAMMFPHGPVGLTMPMSQGPYNDPMSARTVADNLQEVAYPIQPHQPIIALGTGAHSGQGLSRAAYARLYSVGFPVILDRHGEPPDVRDPDSFSSFDPQKEMFDSLHGNDITLQFLAYTRASSFMPGLELSGDKPSTVFFTFQFYRFPSVTTERLLLNESERELSMDNSGMPCVLRKMDKTGQVRQQELPGYEVKYMVDPNFLKPGEARLFVQHLAQQTLHIDVWDGDSLLLIGTAAVELKHLLRQGQESVQVSYELDVISTEYADDTTPNMTGDITRSGSVRPVGVATELKGRLHFRMANCGFPAEKSSHKDIMLYHQETKTIVQTDPNVMAFRGGSLTSSKLASRNNNTYRAQPLAETNTELASMLAPPEKDEHGRMDPTKQRKLARMQAVRMNTGLENQQPFSLKSLKADKSERTRALNTINIYRDQNKHDAICNMLNRSISTVHTVYPSMGSVEFFEYSLKNPYNTPHTVIIACLDEELSVVTDVREWRYYKTLYNLASPIEESMFSQSDDSDCAKVYLRPKERVMVPFKFLSLKTDHSVKPQGPVDPFTSAVRGTDSRSVPTARTAEVHFVTEDDRPISVLNLIVAPQPHVVNQTFRFHHPEQTFFKKAIRLPPFQHNLPGHPITEEGVSQVYVRASDPNVICEAKAVKAGEPMDVFVKVACGQSPEIKKFFVAVYNNPFMARPAQIWQFFIHSLQRVDVACTEGQMSKFTLILRGTHSSRMVKCHSSNPLELAIQPAEAFLLASNTVHELHVSICSKRVGSKFLYINVVDCEYHQLIRTWLICLTCKPPIVSKAFELALPLSRSSNKRITYTNSYQQRKKFSLHTNRDDLLQFKENEMEIGPGETFTISLRFTPCMIKGDAEILIFINDSDQKTEETFCIKAKYS